MTPFPTSDVAGAGDRAPVPRVTQRVEEAAGVTDASARVGALADRTPQSRCTHNPKPPAVDVTALPVAALVAIVVVLAAAGLASFRRRDLALPA
jgi:hypothetical protein